MKQIINWFDKNQASHSSYYVRTIDRGKHASMIEVEDYTGKKSLIRPDSVTSGLDKTKNGEENNGEKQG